MFEKTKPILLNLTLLGAALSASAQLVVYDNLATTATAGYSEPNANNPIFGDQLVLTQGGRISILGVSLFNSSSGGNTGSILTGTMAIKFYDNTTAYAGSGPITGTLLGSATLNWDFTSGGGLPAGFYATDGFDLTSLNIVLPQNVLITQQFTETTGTSTRNGFILFSNPTTGSSPPNVYLKSSATAEGLYTFSGGNPNQVGFYVEVVPEPTTLALAGLAGAAMLFLRRRSS